MFGESLVTREPLEKEGVEFPRHQEEPGFFQLCLQFHLGSVQSNL